MDLLIISDTHLPVRAKDLPEAVWAAVDEVDVVIHAGDWVSVDLLDALQDRPGELLQQPPTGLDKQFTDRVSVATDHECNDRD